MNYRQNTLCLLPLLLAPFACSQEALDDTSDGSRDDAESEDGSSIGGQTSAGGSSSGGNSSGSTTGGSSSGGDESTGVGGDATGGGDPGGDAVPSPGCGKAGRPDGGKVYDAGKSWLIFPEKYDGNTPLPVLFGFHGCGSYNVGDANRTAFWDITRGSKFEEEYVVAAPLATSGSCYDYGTDMPKAKALYDELINNYCVDTSRVFGTGHSYGAGGMLMSLTGSSNAADFAHFNFRGIAPVAGWQIWNQSTQVPTMYIQGIEDSERDKKDGAEVVAKIVDVNQCEDTSTPYVVDACNSSHDKDPVNAGCKLYDGCAETTIWCRHDDSAYDGSFHGIPCFYKQAVYDFFESL